MDPETLFHRNTVEVVCQASLMLTQTIAVRHHQQSVSSDITTPRVSSAPTWTKSRLCNNSTLITCTATKSIINCVPRKMFQFWCLMDVPCKKATTLASHPKYTQLRERSQGGSLAIRIQIVELARQPLYQLKAVLVLQRMYPTRFKSTSIWAKMHSLSASKEQTPCITVRSKNLHLPSQDKYHRICKMRWSMLRGNPLSALKHSRWTLKAVIKAIAMAIRARASPETPIITDRHQQVHPKWASSRRVHTCRQPTPCNRSSPWPKVRYRSWDLGSRPRHHYNIKTQETALGTSRALQEVNMTRPNQI